MVRILLSTTAALALAAGLLVPASSSQASVLLSLNDGEGGTELATFRTAKCRKGKSKRRNALKFTATARSGNGYRLSVDLFSSAREVNFAYGGPNQFTAEGPAGEWSNLNVPPNAPPGGGGVEFNRKRTRMGLAFAPAFSSIGSDSTVNVTGGLTCKYPKKKKRRARRSAASAAARAKTRITDTSVNPNDDGGNRISGVVVSGREKCHNNRKVVLFRKKGRKRNPSRDRKVGSDRATPNGDGSQYRIDFEGSGKYYTYVKQTKACGRAYSGVVSVTEAASAQDAPTPPSTIEECEQAKQDIESLRPALAEARAQVSAKESRVKKVKRAIRRTSSKRKKRQLRRKLAGARRSLGRAKADVEETEAKLTAARERMGQC